MQAYIGEVALSNSPLGICTIICFAGCDFNCGFCNSGQFHETKAEFLIDLREVKKAVEDNDECVYLSGNGCLQRPALIDLARFARKGEKKVGMDSNGSKPECLRSLLEAGLIDFIRMELNAPLQEKSFERVTKSRTFFIQTNEVMEEIKKSLELLREHQDDVDIEFVTTIVPGLMFRIEDLLGIAQSIQFIRSEWALKPFKPEEGLLDKNMKSIEMPSKRFLNNLKKALLKEFHTLRIRVEGYD